MGSFILISLRDFEKDKADVLHVYNDEETKKLKRKICYSKFDLIRKANVKMTNLILKMMKMKKKKLQKK